MVIGCLIFERWPLIAGGARQLLTANVYWLLAAVGVTVLGWAAVSLARQGTVLEPLPARRLFATQFAAGAANHLLPAGLGAGAVNLRFLRKCGLPLGRSSAALALYLLSESVGRCLLLLVLLVAFPDALDLRALHLGQALPDGVLPAAAGLGCAVVLVLTVLTVLALLPALRRAIRTFLTTAFTDLRSLHARPARALALWCGSLGFPALQAAGLVTVALALRMPVPVVHVAIAYLAASVAAALVPTPGGLGSVDAALVVALVTTGASATAATSAVLGFRIITVWLPLVPAALTLGALVRRRVV
ncbi:lysylphosphatidylglycerol synthase transmembrane domain-containing protein [Streptomyces sp. 8L]|uniref:lysylphosphatidylglycerol synthase transmembrane domain-containing protein n=1 Tax=Streptomyces sp. 8L TaxID=2877242 RepID=UPI0027E08C94|nr:lysylphosphatidylglycerol synthase domain-containing protein [Streptomyces sp. 8L]